MTWSNYFSGNRRRKKNRGALQWTLHDWISILTNGGGVKKRFQYYLNPNSSENFLYFRVIKDFLEILLLILSCKTMYCQEWHWSAFNKKKCVDPGKTKSQMGKTIRVLHDSEPDGDENCVEEISCDLTKPRITPDKNTWKTSLEYSTLMQFETRSKRED